MGEAGDQLAQAAMATLLELVDADEPRLDESTRSQLSEAVRSWLEVRRERSHA